MSDRISLVYVEIEIELLGPIWLGTDRTTTWPIEQVQFMLKTIVNCHDRLDQVQSVTKTREDDDEIDCIGAVYTENHNEISWLIELGAVCNEN